MDPCGKSVVGEESQNIADDAGNFEPQPHTVLLCKVCDLFFKAYCETNNGVEEGEKKNEGKEVEVGEGSSTRVDQVINEATTEVHEKALGEWIEIGDKEEKGNDVLMTEDDSNEGGAEAAEVEAEVAAEVAPRRIFGIDLNRSPPQEEDIDLNRSPPQEED